MLKGLYDKLLFRLDITGRDLAVMLLSLLLAFGLWFTHNLSLQYSSLVTVPVTATSNLDGHAQSSSNTAVIAARCRSTGYNLLHKRRSSSRPVTVYFSPDDLHKVDGEQFSISAGELSLYIKDIFGDNVQLESFISDEVVFRFAVENHKTVPVVPVCNLSYKPQYMAQEPLKAVPDSVVVYGDPVRLQAIESVSTETISHQGLSSDAHGMARLDTPRGVSRMSDTQVSYSLKVTRFVEISSEVKVKVRGVPAGKEIAVYPSVARVVYRCAFPLTADPTDKVSFYIDYADFSSSRSGRCVPHVSGLPSSVLDYRIEPEVFECMEGAGR